MGVRFLAPDPLDASIGAVLDGLAAGRAPQDIESTNVDIKEEAGRRSHGVLRAGTSRSDVAAAALAPECACFANTPGGGALVLGVADHGEHIGTDLDPAWLRHRLYELLDRKVTVEVQAVLLNERTRLLVIRVPPAVEPVRHRGRLQWRVGTSCVDIDATAWFESRPASRGIDWSAERSPHTWRDARREALERARQYLRDSGEPSALDLASAPDADLLQRLNVVDAEGSLTNAGALLFVGRAHAGLDYIRRESPGGDSRLRLRTAGRGLIEELYDAGQAVTAANRTLHLPAGLVMGQVPALPPLAVREAMVNGVAHRDWRTDEPTTVEHVGDTLVVSSPGGFVAGIDKTNIITHPSTPRHRSLAEALASLRVAEREGIGVDRMVRDMIRLGLAHPDIDELPGPRVGVTLVGGQPDGDWMRLLTDAEPAGLADDLDALLLLRHVADHGWVDASRGRAPLQRPLAFVSDAIARLASHRLDGTPVISAVLGTPPGQEPAWRLSAAARGRLRRLSLPAFGSHGRARLALEWARARGRISSTELVDLTGMQPNHASTLLRSLEDDGHLTPSRAARTGRGFHYLPVRNG